MPPRAQILQAAPIGHALLLSLDPNICQGHWPSGLQERARMGATPFSLDPICSVMSLPRVPRSRPRPKLRSIPRRKTESALYAEMQQLTVEKQRLNQELEFIQERQGQIQARLWEIEQALQRFQQEAERFRDPAAAPELATGRFSSSRFPPMTFEY